LPFRQAFVTITRKTHKIGSGQNFCVAHALGVADKALAAGPDGIFCCNDRLAQAVLQRAADREMPRPLIIGFDDAPVAQRLNL
jgi:DNA-binding LacI/PurR family transcriptional regulator